MTTDTHSRNSHDTKAIDETVTSSEFDNVPLTQFPFSASLTVNRLNDYAFVIDNFLTPEEVEHLVSVAETDLRPGKVGGLEDGGSLSQETRRCDEYTFASNGKQAEDPVARRIQQRISAFSGRPVEHQLLLQFARYGSGGFFSPHCDWVDPEFEQDVIDKQGQPFMAFVIYLNDVPEEAGGATAFLDWKVSVQPKKGSALLFFNSHPSDNYRVLHDSAHSAEPVVGDAHKDVLLGFVSTRPQTQSSPTD